MTSGKELYWVVAETSIANAGYRVRALPLAEGLEALGAKPIFLSVADFPQKVKEIASSAKVVIVSKPSDTATYLCIRYLRTKGVKVVADLFDNYFSWSPAIARSELWWHWLRATSACSAVFVSTPYLASVLDTLGFKGAACIGDALPPINANMREVFGKWDNRQELRIVWFGINGNPFYSAGIADLMSWLHTVAAIRDMLPATANISLTVCTKRCREIDVPLGASRRFGIDVSFLEWSEEACANLLADSHLVLIPTNMCGFSLSKTHNRCSDALAKGCVVLSSPGGPYADIPGAVFSSVTNLCNFLESHSADDIYSAIETSLAHLEEKFNRLELGAHLRDLLSEHEVDSECNSVSNPQPQFLMVGRIRNTVVKFARTVGYLLCHFHGTPQAWNFDVFLDRIDAGNSTIKLRLSEIGWRALIDHLHSSENAAFGAAADSWIVGSLSIVLDSSTSTCTIACPVYAERLLRLERLAEIRGKNVYFDDCWFDENIGLLTAILQSIGFRDIQLAADASGGWDAFVDVAAPDLVERAAQLRKYWNVDAKRAYLPTHAAGSL